MLTVLALAFLVLASLFALSHPQHDFIEYWTASHLLLHGGNPYSLTEMFEMQRSLGWNEQVPLMFVCPPWGLALIAPLGLCTSYGAAWLAWSAFLIFALAFSSWLLMNLYFADLRIPEISDTAFHRSLIAFTFYPVLLALKFSQISPLLLLGLSGFLYFTRSDRFVLAGLMLSLALLKPQLLFLIWIALLFDSVYCRRWKTLLASVAAVLAAIGIALLLDPQAFHQYRELLATSYLASNPSGIVAAIRIALIPQETHWMQFMPPVFGLSWLIFYWSRYRDRWDWLERMPALVTASVLTAAYGWIFDQTVLIVPIIALCALRAQNERKISRADVTLYTALNCLTMLLYAVPRFLYLPGPIFLTAFFFKKECRAGVFKSKPQDLLGSTRL